MTDNQKLELIIKKAIHGGYKLFGIKNAEFDTTSDGIIESLDDRDLWTPFDGDIIFSHDFCKAYFGEKELGDGWYETFSWEYHIKQLALSTDRLEYLYEHLEESK